MSIYREVSFAAQVLNDPALSWSEDGRIALCTEEGIVVMHLQTNPSILRKQLAIHLSRVAVPEHIHELNVNVDRGQIERHVVKHNEADWYCLLLDRTISPSIQSMVSHKGYKAALWSPHPASMDGRCVLATLTKDHRLCIHKQKKAETLWIEVLDLSELYYAQVKVQGWKSVEGECQKAMDQLKARSYALAAIDMSWSWTFTDNPFQETSIKRQKLEDSEAEQTKTDFALLAVAMRNGQIVIWKHFLPLDDQSDTQLVVAVKPSNQEPTCVCVCRVDDNLGFTVIGYHNGIVKAFVLRRYVDDGSISVGEATDLWKDKDNVAVKVISWNCKDRILFVAKGPFLFAFEIQAKSKSMEVAIIRSNHIAISNSLPINSLWFSSPDLHVSIQNGKMFTVRASRDQGLKMEHHPISVPHNMTDRRSHGLCTSRNSVLLAMADSPSANYCHSTLKEPLRVHIINIRTRKDVIELLMEPQEEHMGTLWDALIYMRQVCLQEERLPEELQKLFESSEAWPQMSSYKLKLARYFLTVHLQQMKIKEVEGPVPCEIEQLDDLLLKRYIHGSLSNLVGMEFKDTQLTEEEISSAIRMCEWVESRSYFSDSKLEHITADIREKLGPSSAVEESCPVCKQKVELSDCRKGACERKHYFSRCSLSLQLCQGVTYRKCKGCEVFALIFPEDSFQWLVCSPNECIFCDSPLILV